MFFDVDGTLISKDGVLPSSAVSAIHRFREDGNIAVLFTGRPYGHIDTRIRGIGFDAAIAVMGAYVRIENNLIQNLTLTGEDIKTVLPIIHECRMYAAFEAEDGIRFDEKGTVPEFLRGIREVFKRKGLYLGSITGNENTEYSKITLWFDKNSDVRTCDDQISLCLKLAGKKQNIEEWISKDADLNESMQKVIQYFGVEQSDTYSCGDSINDLPMMNNTAHKAAMGNADDQIKNRVEFITSDVVHDGLEKLMVQWKLIS